MLISNNILVNRTAYQKHLGIAELQDSGRKSWTLDCERLTVDTGAWTLEPE